ncbi:alpha/beta fold hydrolase [Lentzea sp. CC55]|uniref:alpha/beta fold hydrolase n=1 Tax=Lentzea sp. CC55 TaxID=2884909 RepID=UPI0027E1AC37|nr:alpha/beta hydrolase [Lentzea sp. CC55]MCG8926730.1 alpha/beta hydrolase [Lentzea sp. CC55]
MATSLPVWSAADEDGVQHAVAEVPLDYSDPAGERISLKLTRIPAIDPARRRGVLVAINGGPGGDDGLGARMPAELRRTTSLNEVYDLVGFDPRGTGDSTFLGAEASPITATFDSRPPDEQFPLIAADMKEREEGCSRAGGTLRRHVSTRNLARDIESIRALLGEGKINYLGYAYGTMVGAVYGTMFPDRLDRSVLDSCKHPRWDWRTQFKAQGPAIRSSVDAWAGWVGDRVSRYELGAGATEVIGSVEGVAAGLAALTPSPLLRTLFDQRIGVLAPRRHEWDQLARLVVDLRKAVAHGDPAAAEALLAGQSAWRPGSTMGGLREAVLEAVTLESEWPADLEVYYADMREFREKYPYGFGVMRAQPWVGTFATFKHTEPFTDVVRDGYPVGLVVQTDSDPWSCYEGGVEMARTLGHRMITVTDSGGHETFAFAGNAVVDHLVTRYLVDGELPEEDVTCAGDPRPEVPADDVVR